MKFLAKKTLRTPLFKNTKEESPNFLLKLYNILDTPEYSEIISWDSAGKMVIMKHINLFTEKILPLFYKHSNYSSFVRQLNMYDFHKKKSGENEEVFHHFVFNKGNKELVKSIKRKRNKKKGSQNERLNHLSNNNKDTYHVKANNNNDKNDNQTIIDIETNVMGKKATKVSIENTLNQLAKRVNFYRERQQLSNSKIDDLNEKNEHCLKSNNQILKEYVSKTEYKAKLEAIIMLIIEVLLKQSQIKQSPGLHEVSKLRKNSNAIKPQTPEIKLSEMPKESPMNALINFLNYKQNSFSALNQLIAKTNIKHANDYIMLSPKLSREYPSLLLSNSSIQPKLINNDESIYSNSNSCEVSCNSLFNARGLSTMNNGLMNSSHTNINRIGEDGSNISLHSKNIFDFDSDDCIINTVNELN